MPDPLHPPQVETLEPPKPVQPVAKEQADQMIRLNDVTVSLLDEKVNEFIGGVVSEPAQSEEFQDKVSAIHNLGNAEIRASANVSNRF